MEKLVDELKKIVSFKDTTDVGDHVLILSKEPQMIVYALVSSIERDPDRKKNEWWQVTLHLLSLPPQKVVWTLRIPQFTGMEIFTMKGVEHFVKAVDLQETAASHDVKETVKEENNTTEKKTNPFKLVK